MQNAYVRIASGLAGRVIRGVNRGWANPAHKRVPHAAPNALLGR